MGLPHINDPAYAEIKRHIIYLDLLNVTLTSGRDGGVNWEMATGADRVSTKCVHFAWKMLEDARTSFRQIAIGEEPSENLQLILDTAVEVKAPPWRLRKPLLTGTDC